MRKRIGALILAGAITACSTIGWAEEIDISSYTLDQLVELRDEINELLAEKMGESTTIGAGSYRVGTDIKPGYYEIACSKNASYGFINVEIYPSQEDYDNGENRQSVSQIRYDENTDNPEHATVNVVEGDILVLSGDGVIESTVKPSWFM